MGILLDGSVSLKVWEQKQFDFFLCLLLAQVPHPLWRNQSSQFGPPLQLFNRIQMGSDQAWWNLFSNVALAGTLGNIVREAAKTPLGCRYARYVLSLNVPSPPHYWLPSFIPSPLFFFCVWAQIGWGWNVPGNGTTKQRISHFSLKKKDQNIVYETIYIHFIPIYSSIMTCNLIGFLTKESTATEIT